MERTADGGRWVKKAMELMKLTIRLRSRTKKTPSPLAGDGRGEGVRARRSALSPSAVRCPLFTVIALAAMTGCVSAPQKPDESATWQEPPPMATHGNGAIYQAGTDSALFDNSVARRVGDTLTIRLDETTNASKSSSTTTKKSTSVDLPGP